MTGGSIKIRRTEDRSAFIDLDLLKPVRRDPSWLIAIIPPRNSRGRIGFWRSAPSASRMKTGSRTGKAERVNFEIVTAMLISFKLLEREGCRSDDDHHLERRTDPPSFRGGSGRRRPIGGSRARSSGARSPFLRCDQKTRPSTGGQSRRSFREVSISRPRYDV